MMRRTHAHHREQDNDRFFVPYRIAVRNHLRPADPKANITFRFVNHNGTALGLPGYAYVHGLATGTEVTLVAVKTLLAPCLNWEAVVRSISYPIGRHIRLKSQVRLKVLHELRSHVIDLREWKTVSFALRYRVYNRGYWSLTPLTTVCTGLAITVWPYTLSTWLSIHRFGGRRPTGRHLAIS